MKRFLFHTVTNTMPAIGVTWEGVIFANGSVALSLLSGKVLDFVNIEVMMERFTAGGTAEIEWIDRDVPHVPVPRRKV